jgi:GxxExxY protein
MHIEDDITDTEHTTINVCENVDYNTQYLNNDIIQLIINCSNNIFRNLGLGFIEYIYHKALLVDLYKTNYTIETKKILPIYYNGVNIGYVEPDIIVENENYYIIIELKAFDKNIGKKEELQINKYINHIQTPKTIIGIIINFNQNINNIDSRMIQHKFI